MLSTTLFQQYRYVAVAIFLVTVFSQMTDCRADLDVGAESMINLFKNSPDPTMTAIAADVTSEAPSVDTDDASSDSPSVLDDTSAVLNNTREMRSGREMPPLIPELLSRLPMGKLFDIGSKAINVARFWPAGLTSLVVGTAPTTGAIVGVISILIFIIVIWLVIYSVGVLPVGAAMMTRDEMMPAYLPPPAFAGNMLPPPGSFAGRPYPNSQFYYNQRAKRSLAEASRHVMEAVNQFQLKNE